MITLRGQNNGVDQRVVERMKNEEMPNFINGRLQRTKPLRHKNMKCNFYFTNKEWFNSKQNDKEVLPQIEKSENSIVATSVSANGSPKADKSVSFCNEIISDNQNRSRCCSRNSTASSKNSESSYSKEW